MRKLACIMVPVHSALQQCMQITLQRRQRDRKPEWQHCPLVLHGCRRACDLLPISKYDTCCITDSSAQIHVRVFIRRKPSSRYNPSFFLFTWTEMCICVHRLIEHAKLPMAFTHEYCGVSLQNVDDGGTLRAYRPVRHLQHAAAPGIPLSPNPVLHAAWAGHPCLPGGEACSPRVSHAHGL